MPPILSTSWDDSASSVEIDDYGDVFCTTLSSYLMPFGALLVSSGCLETRSTRDLGQGRRDLGPPRKFPVDLGAIWDGLGRPCVPQGVQKYVPRDENGSNFEAFWRDFVVLWILMILMTVSHEIHVFAAGRRSKEGDF